jgi:fused signal recognition particle receptor
MAFDTVRGLPVIGGLAGSLYDLAGGALGFEDVRGMQRNADVLSRINAGANVESQVAALRANAATTRQARETQLRAARGDRLAAAGALAEFNARPGDFFTEDRLGVSNQAQGQLRLAQVQAEERARAAASVQFDERQALIARQRERQDAEARLAEARTREAQAQREADDAKAAQRNKGFGLSPAAIAQNQRIDERAEERQNALSQARLSTLKAEQQVREKITAEQQQLERLEKAGLATIQANVEAAKARLEVQKNQIALLREQESAQKQQARFFGTADEGTRQAAVRAIEAFKRGGLDALTPDEIELAKQVNPRIAEEIIRAQEQRGLATEENRRVEQLTGYTGLNDLKAEIQQQQENLTRQMLELQKEQAALVERTMAENLKQFTDLFVKAVEAAITNVRSEAAKQIADQKVLQAGQG